RIGDARGHLRGRFREARSRAARFERALDRLVADQLHHAALARRDRVRRLGLPFPSDVEPFAGAPPGPGALHAELLARSALSEPVNLAVIRGDAAISGKLPHRIAPAEFETAVADERGNFGTLWRLGLSGCDRNRGRDARGQQPLQNGLATH